MAKRHNPILRFFRKGKPIAKKNIMEDQTQPTVEETVQEAPVAPVADRAAFNCTECKGEGLKDEATLCPACKGTGKAGGVSGEYAGMKDGTIVITKDGQHEVRGGQLFKV